MSSPSALHAHVFARVFRSDRAFRQELPVGEGTNTPTTTMPRAVTRAISTSFAGPHSYSAASSRDMSSGKASHGLDLYPSPRPMKAARASAKPVTASVSSPSTRTATVSTSGPVTPPTKQQPEKRKRGKEDGMPQRQIDTFLANYDLEGERFCADEIRSAIAALMIPALSQRQTGYEWRTKRCK